MTTRKKRTKRRVFSDAVRTESKVVAYGYVGRWLDGTLGWMLPNHAGGMRREAEALSGLAKEHAPDGCAFELCRITVEVVPGARRRIFRRRPSPPPPEPRDA